MSNDIDKMENSKPAAVAYAARPRTATWVPILVVILTALAACIAYFFFTDISL